MDRGPAPIKGGSVPLTSATYTVVRSSTTVSMKVNGSTLESIAASNICWTSTGAAYYGEVYDTGDQMGGSVGDTQRFTSAIYEGTIGGPWFSASLSAPCADVHTPYDCRVLSGNSLEIWTDRS
jgi:hypothetical protein